MILFDWLLLTALHRQQGATELAADRQVDSVSSPTTPAAWQLQAELLSGPAKVGKIHSRPS